MTSSCAMSRGLLSFCVLLLLGLLSSSPCLARAFNQQASCFTPVFSPGQSPVVQNGTFAVGGINGPSIFRQPVVLANASTVLTVNLYPFGYSPGTLRIAAALYDSSFPDIGSVKYAQTAIITVVNPNFSRTMPTPMSLNFTTPAKVAAGNYSIVFWKTWTANQPALQFFADSIDGIHLDFFHTNNTGLDFNADQGILPSPWNTKFSSYGNTGPGFITSVNVELPCSLTVSSVSSSTGLPALSFSNSASSALSFSSLSVIVCLVMAVVVACQRVLKRTRGQSEMWRGARQGGEMRLIDCVTE